MSSCGHKLSVVPMGGSRGWSSWSKMHPASPGYIIKDLYTDPTRSSKSGLLWTSCGPATTFRDYPPTNSQWMAALNQTYGDRERKRERERSIKPGFLGAQWYRDWIIERWVLLACVLEASWFSLIFIRYAYVIITLNRNGCVWTWCSTSGIPI